MARLDPKPIADLIAEDTFAPLIAAIRTELKGLFLSVKVISHIGKLDVSDILAADISTLPSIMIGWTRVLPDRSPADHFQLNVDLTAYIAVQDWVDLQTKRSVPRVEVAQAIGLQLIRILSHDDHNLWGLKGITRPFTARPPEIKPVFTAASYSKGVAYYAVTWTQAIIDQGISIATDYDTQVMIEDDRLVLDDMEADEVLAFFRNELGGDDA